MAILPGRLGTLTARDVMTAQVIVVYEQDTLETAMATLREHHITGAPVVDDENRFVGILSISDVIPGEGRGDSLMPPLVHGVDKVTWELYDRATPIDPQLSTDKVYSRMTQPVTSITVNASLVEAARVMCDGHWHRVPVIDKDGSLAGIISTLDVLAALVNTADEPG
jgi:CBS domain-containing membrane protein